MDFTGENSLFVSFGNSLSKILSFIAVLIIGYIVALILRAITRKALKRLGVDHKLMKSPAHNIVRRLTTEPSELVAKFIYWLAIIITVTIAIAILNVPVFNNFLQGVYGYVPNILAAILILAVALAISTAVSSLIIKLMGDTPTGKIVSTVIPVIVLTIATFAILDQLKIAPDIVNITYIGIVASLSLGFAIAFGLGARTVAAQLFEQAYKTGRENMGQIRKDIEKGKERGEREVDKNKRKFEENK